MNRPLRRRQFLRGLAGFSLALPFLPSLAPRVAEAQEAGTKRLVTFGTGHGGIWQSSMYPAESALTESLMYSHEIRRGALVAEQQGNDMVISPVLRAASSRLTPSILQRMNLLRGLDITFYIAHHNGGHLGNYAQNVEHYGTDKHIPTIDQRLAYSEEFYGNADTIMERALVLGSSTNAAGMSANWSNPQDPKSPVNNITPQSNSLALFNSIFTPPDDGTEVRPHIADRVLEDYKRLREGNRRLSAKDRARLDAHLEMIDELDRKLNATGSCNNVTVPTENSSDFHNEDGSFPSQESLKRYWELYNDVIVAAFACDSSRIATIEVTSVHEVYAGDWHQDIAHQARFPNWPIKMVNQPDPNGPHPHQYMVNHCQNFFEDVFLDLANKLEALDDGMGGSVLDTALLQWSQESGPNTHESIELPIVTIGGAAGFFQTGQYCDYRDLNNPGVVAAVEPNDYGFNTHLGLVYNQWLGTVLQSMGMSPENYESGAYGGYGELVLESGNKYYSKSVIDRMGEVLPFLQA